jgi:hypothetical protein
MEQAHRSVNGFEGLMDSSGNPDIFKHMLEMQGRIGANEAKTEAAIQAQRDTNLKIDKLGDKFEGHIGQLRAEWREDTRMRHDQVMAAISRIAKENETARDDRITRAVETLATHAVTTREEKHSWLIENWKTIFLCVVIITAIVFGAGVGSGSDVSRYLPSF